MPETICYCFNYTVVDIQRDCAINGRSTILERIKAERNAGRCECDVKHPRGR